VLWKVPFKTFFGILSSSILIIWPTHPSHLIFTSSMMFKSLYRVYSSLFHLGRQRPPSCIGPHILRSTFYCTLINKVDQQSTPYVHYNCLCTSICYLVQTCFDLNCPSSGRR
jgi:hypothetical protein